MLGNQTMSSDYSCPKCRKSFGTMRGLKTHRSKAHRDWLIRRLKKLYIRKNLSTGEIAERLNIARGTVNNRLREFGLNKKDPAKFVFEGQSKSNKWGKYPRWTSTGSGQRLRVHRLLAIADGADPHKVFSGKWDVDHINGCHLDNRPENLRIMKKGDHGAKDGERSSVGHSHKEYLEALVQEPPGWAQNLPADDEY